MKVGKEDNQDFIIYYSLACNCNLANSMHEVGKYY